MTADPNAALVEALEHFLQEAKRAVDEELHRDTPLPLTPQMLAESLVGLPSAREAAAAIHRAAAANEYLVTSLPRRQSSDEPAAATDATAESKADDETTEPGGRPLDAAVLISTGVFGMLQSRAPHDFHAVAGELARYLAGPQIGIWEYAILDANFTINDPIPVIDGWDLATPTSEELRQLLPLPSTADYQPTRPFKPQDYGGLTMLRRKGDDRPHHGPFLRFDVLGSLALDRRTHPLWRPLLLLSLFENSVLRLWARYQIEPGRRIDKLFDDVDWEVWTPDGVTDIEQPRTGDFGEDADLPAARRFLSELASRMPDDFSNQTGRQEDKTSARLRRCAEHFLSAGHHAYGEGEVMLSELNAETVLHYVIALEGLLAGGESDHSELTRKVSQRAAVLAGKEDAQRLETERLVRGAYGARSKYAHGDPPPRDDVDLPKLRRVVRRCLLARLVIGDPTPDGALREVADQALLSHEVLERCIHQPLNEFSQRVRGE